MGLVKVAVHGYESSRASGLQGDPLYMDKILFHILKKVAALGSQTWCQFMGDLLYDRLALAAVVREHQRNEWRRALVGLYLRMFYCPLPGTYAVDRGYISALTALW